MGSRLKQHLFTSIPVCIITVRIRVGVINKLYCIPVYIRMVSFLQFQFITFRSILCLQSVLPLILRHFATVFQFIPLLQSCTICCFIIRYAGLPPVLSKNPTDRSSSVSGFLESKAIEIYLKTAVSSDIKFSKRFLISIEATAEEDTCKERATIHMDPPYCTALVLQCPVSALNMYSRTGPNSNIQSQKSRPSISCNSTIDFPFSTNPYNFSTGDMCFNQ